MSIKISNSKNIIDTLSVERIWSYYKKVEKQAPKNQLELKNKEFILKNLSDKTLNQIIDLYYNNIILSQKAYMLLNLFEISLRSKMDKILKQEISDDRLIS